MLKNQNYLRDEQMARLFNDIQEQFIRQNVKGVGNKELADLVNKTFHLKITPQQMSAWKKNHKLSSGLTGYFKKGHIPVNKGKKGLFNLGGNSTSFKKGNKPLNWKPIGSERVDRDGYVLVKVKDGERWRSKHVVLWEEVHGPIPDGYKLIFLNQNKLDIRIENLKLISKAEGLEMNRNGWFSSDSTVTDFGSNVAMLRRKIYEKKKDSEKHKKNKKSLPRLQTK